jgi:hypothetical protein
MPDAPPRPRRQPVPPPGARPRAFTWLSSCYPGSAPPQARRRPPRPPHQRVTPPRARCRRRARHPDRVTRRCCGRRHRNEDRRWTHPPPVARQRRQRTGHPAPRQGRRASASRRNTRRRSPCTRPTRRRRHGGARGSTCARTLPLRRSGDPRIGHTRNGSHPSEIPSFASCRAPTAARPNDRALAPGAAPGASPEGAMPTLRRSTPLLRRPPRVSVWWGRTSFGNRAARRGLRYAVPAVRAAVVAMQSCIDDPARSERPRAVERVAATRPDDFEAVAPITHRSTYRAS